MASVNKARTSIIISVAIILLSMLLMCSCSPKYTHEILEILHPLNDKVNVVYYGITDSKYKGDSILDTKYMSNEYKEGYKWKQTVPKEKK